MEPLITLHRKTLNILMLALSATREERAKLEPLSSLLFQAKFACMHLAVHSLEKPEEARLYMTLSKELSALVEAAERANGTPGMRPRAFETTASALG